jgi:hypothetical protein
MKTEHSPLVADTLRDAQLHESVRGQLFALQTRLESLLDETERSYALWDIGEKTALTQVIEEVLANPLKELVMASVSIHVQVLHLIERTLVSSMQKHKALIQSIYVQQVLSRELRFFIVLNQDDEESRSQMFDLLSVYEEGPFNSLYPVYFHFIDASWVELLSDVKEIKLV